MHDFKQPLSLPSRTILAKKLVGIQALLLTLGDTRVNYQRGEKTIGQLRELALRAGALADEITAEENQQRIEGV